jgi:hypothetical protein
LQEGRRTQESNWTLTKRHKDTYKGAGGQLHKGRRTLSYERAGGTRTRAGHLQEERRTLT